MVSVLSDMYGIFLIQYMPRKSTISDAVYTLVLEKLSQSIRNNGRANQKNRIWFHDDALAYSSEVSLDALAIFGFWEFFHPPYSTDLDPSYYYLFWNFKKSLNVGRFWIDDERCSRHFQRSSSQKKNILFQWNSTFRIPFGAMYYVHRRVLLEK